VAKKEGGVAKKRVCVAKKRKTVAKSANLLAKKKCIIANNTAPQFSNTQLPVTPVSATEWLNHCGQCGMPAMMSDQQWSDAITP
jgi:hypothetical protein